MKTQITKNKKDYFYISKNLIYDLCDYLILVPLIAGMNFAFSLIFIEYVQFYPSMLLQILYILGMIIMILVSIKIIGEIISEKSKN